MPPGAWGREVKVNGSVEICDVVSSKTLVFVCVYALHPNQQLCPPPHPNRREGGILFLVRIPSGSASG